MNKYQEAIKRVELNFEHRIEEENLLYGRFRRPSNPRERMISRIDVEALQELVDRAIPVKPVVLTKTICCGKCDTILGDNDLWTQTIVSFCPDCGQAIDWSEDE